jgi:hypothetical protein
MCVRVQPNGCVLHRRLHVFGCCVLGWCCRLSSKAMPHAANLGAPVRRRPTLSPKMTLGHSMVFASTPGTGQCLWLIYSDTHNQTPLTHAELSASPMNALTCNGRPKRDFTKRRSKKTLAHVPVQINIFQMANASSGLRASCDLCKRAQATNAQAPCVTA